MSGQGNDGQMIGMSTSTSPVAGKIGQALNFDGSTQYIDMGSPSSLYLSSVGTISAWVKITSFPGFFAEIAGRYDNNADKGGYELGVYDTGKFDFVIANNVGGQIDEVISASSYNDNHWHLVTGIMDGSSVRLYVDGSLVSTVVQTVTPANINNFNIARDAEAFGIGGDYFSGKVDDVRIYNRALNAQEVRQLYRLGRVRI
jgi:hypothetical protein